MKKTIDISNFNKSIIENINAFIFVINNKLLDAIWVNNESFFYSILGYNITIDDLRLGKILTYMHPDDKGVIFEQIRYFQENKGEAYNCIYRLQKSDGSWQWVISNTKIFKKDTEGKPEEIISLLICPENNFKYSKNIEIYLKEILKNKTFENFTDRERQIYYLYIEGLNTKEISQKLNIAVNTVKKVFTNMYKKGFEK